MPDANGDALARFKKFCAKAAEMKNGAPPKGPPRSEACKPSAEVLAVMKKHKEEMSSPAGKKDLIECLNGVKG